MKKYIGIIAVITIAFTIFAASFLSSCNKQNYDLDRTLFGNNNTNNNNNSNNNNNGTTTGQMVTALAITVRQYSITGQTVEGAIVKLATSEDNWNNEVFLQPPNNTDQSGMTTINGLTNGQKYWIWAEFQLGANKLTNTKSMDASTTPNPQGQLDTITAITQKRAKTMNVVVQ